MGRATLFLLVVIFVQAICPPTVVMPTVYANSERLTTYPILGNNPFPRLVSKDLKLATEALEYAKLLTRSCGCDKALQEYGINSLNELMVMSINADLFDGRYSSIGLPYLDNDGNRETVQNRFLKNRRWLVAEVVEETFTGAGRKVFLNRYFFNPAREPTTALQQRAIILIHEAVHLVANKRDADFGGSRKLTELVSKRCLPGLYSVDRLGLLSM
ncbi:MAG: hypothetical protein AB1489_41675 [Acidobacteriota bacterium]